MVDADRQRHFATRFVRVVERGDDLQRLPGVGDGHRQRCTGGRGFVEALELGGVAGPDFGPVGEQGIDLAADLLVRRNDAPAIPTRIIGRVVALEGDVLEGEPPAG